MITYENSDSEEEYTSNLFNPIKVQIITVSVILICNFFIGSGLVLGLQDIIPNAFNKQDMNFFDALYFMIITSTTIGYGEIIPTHTASRMLTILGIFIRYAKNILLFIHMRLYYIIYS